MSPEISTLVSEYADYLDEVAPPVTVEELETMVGRVPLHPVPGPSAPGVRRGWLVAAAAAVIVLLAGVLVVWAQRPGGDRTPVITQPDPTTTTVPESSPTTVPEPAPTTLPPPDAAPRGDLTWQPVDFGATADVFLDVSYVHDGGDRFVLVHGDRFIEAISTSFDGVTWTTRSVAGSAGDIHGILGVWEDTLLTRGGGGAIQAEGGPIVPVPSTVAVLSPDGTVNRRVFDADVNAGAIGPAGVVVVASSFQIHDDDIVFSVLGEDFADNLSQTDLRDGILYAETTDGRTAEIVLAEHGYDAEDLVDRYDGWYTSDGQSWAPISDFPSGIAFLVGTRGGFVGISGDTHAWHSADGQTWRDLGAVGVFPGGPLVRWKDGALITDGATFAYVSAGGIEPLPVPPEARAALPNQAPFPVVGSGFGIVAIDLDEGDVSYSPDGVSWSTTNLPADMARANSWGWFSASGAATDEAVLMLLWDETTGEQVASWWLGTLS